jgi:hypothetical protein
MFDQLRQELLAWAPGTELLDGLARTSEYFDQLLSSDVKSERPVIGPANLGR